MYEYRRMTPDERRAIVALRQTRRWPWHGPPHLATGSGLFLLSAACYEHRPLLAATARLTEFCDALLGGLPSETGAELHAWAVMPNHYHLLVTGELSAMAAWLGRLHNRKATQWNREDGAVGRKVWHRYTDRRCRSEGHYCATVNYVHSNPVKHGYVPCDVDWPWSSVHRYIAEMGPQTLALWRSMHPVRNYGRGWDD